jgi:hypothetical protein
MRRVEACVCSLVTLAGLGGLSSSGQTTAHRKDPEVMIGLDVKKLAKVPEHRPASRSRCQPPRCVDRVA